MLEGVGAACTSYKETQIHFIQSNTLQLNRTNKQWMTCKHAPRLGFARTRAAQIPESSTAGRGLPLSSAAASAAPAASLWTSSADNIPSDSAQNSLHLPTKNKSPILFYPPISKIKSLQHTPCRSTFTYRGEGVVSRGLAGCRAHEGRVGLGLPRGDIKGGEGRGGCVRNQTRRR